MIKNEGISEFDPAQIPRPTGIDHLGKRIDPTDTAQPNPYYVHNPGINGLEDLESRMETARQRIEEASDKIRTKI